MRRATTWTMCLCLVSRTHSVKLSRQPSSNWTNCPLLTTS
ncbi:hypothetical protein NXF25_006616 [Crotalus adamanteus]|uniref:Uncharacterized protein n=1 Tax=Crotalus adamanteus TaxID=8729 RepID=A0AAW1C0J6_CROAD